MNITKHHHTVPSPPDEFFSSQLHTSRHTKTMPAPHPDTLLHGLAPKHRNRLLPMLAALTILISGLFAAQPARAGIAIFADTLYTMNGDPVEQGVVLIRNGLIEQVGRQSDVSVPDEYQRHEESVVTPGLIDARSVVGLAGFYNQPHDQDQLEYSDAVQPELRAIDAYNAREELVLFLRKNGITTVHTGHAPGALVSGQTMIVKTTGNTVAESVVDSVSALAITLGSVIRNHYDTPGTRAKSVAMLRQELIRAREYLEMDHEDSDQQVERNLRMEALGKLLTGHTAALITAHRAVDIASALRLQQEFGFRLWLEGASESPLLLEQIAEAGIPIIIHPTMIRPRGDAEHAAFNTAARLADAGIPVAFQSGYESYVPKTRVALYEAAVAAGHGMPRLEALRSLTAIPAEILGISDRVGTIEPGKDADLVLFDGDPFEYTTRPRKVLINGVVYQGGYRQSSESD